MPFRERFDCLWCGTSWTVARPDDLEGFAQLCPSCIGRAGENEFLRFRLKAALAERGRSAAPAGEPRTAPASGPARHEAAPAERREAVREAPREAVPSTPGESDLAAEMIAYYEARAGEYDDWYLRRGRYSHGPIHDQAWEAELDQATLWLDRLPLGGDIQELAAGTGWWSPLLVGKGGLTITDAAGAPLDRARDRLLAHGLRAHIHVRDAWAEPDRSVDALFCGFWLSHVPADRLDAFLALARRWLRPGGTFAFVDSKSEPTSGAVDQPPSPTAGLANRRLADGREFRVVKVFHRPPELEAALLRAGFASSRVTETARFFILGEATA